MLKDKEAYRAYRRDYYHRTKKNKKGGEGSTCYSFEEMKNRSLISSYGITIQEYKELSEAQNNVCAICGNAETATLRGKVKSLAVDHCHQSGKVRGLLCADCNRALGMFKDNIQTIENAAEYLRGF